MCCIYFFYNTSFFRPISPFRVLCSTEYKNDVNFLRSISGCSAKFQELKNETISSMRKYVASLQTASDRKNRLSTEY